MFLSLLELRPGDLSVLRDIADAGELHRTIMRAFPQGDGPTPRSDFGVLFRAEFRGPKLSVVVQSDVEPDWGRLPAGYLRSAQQKDVSAALDGLVDGRELRFLLVANPSRKSSAARRHEPPPRNSRRVALTTDDARHGWLAQRGGQHGFEIVGHGPHGGVRIDPLPVGSVPRRRHSTGVVVKPVRFEGRLRITDANRMRDAVHVGIGPAKAYGCGLLSLAPG